MKLQLARRRRAVDSLAQADEGDAQSVQVLDERNQVPQLSSNPRC